MGDGELNKNHANRRFGPRAAGNKMSTARSDGPPTLHANEGNARCGNEEGRKGGEENREGKGYSFSSPKPSRAKKRNGRKTAFIKLSADVHTSLCPPPLPPSASLSSPFTPPAKATELPTLQLLLSRRSFLQPSRS